MRRMKYWEEEEYEEEGEIEKEKEGKKQYNVSVWG